jgi:succinate dehydrogenase / fumarate reductase iron-sulfur subunit
MSLSLKICRFDPEVDREPYFQEFRVEIAGHQTVLDVLLEAWRQDPGLSFRRSCRSAICGSCAVTINGTPRLACQTLIRSKSSTPRASFILSMVPNKLVTTGIL